MLSYFSKKMNQKGFTLIELIVVIAIIGILIAIAVPRLSGFTNQATNAANNATARTIEGAVAIALANGDLTDDDEATDKTAILNQVDNITSAEIISVTSTGTINVNVTSAGTFEVTY